MLYICMMQSWKIIVRHLENEMMVVVSYFRRLIKKTVYQTA